MTDDASRLARVRRLLLLLMLASLPGIALELLLLEHFDDPWQFTPYVIITLSLIALVWHALRPGKSSFRFLRVTMALSVLSGALGIVLHIKGNIEFELEMTPGATGFPLFKEAMMGATPALAPGTMMLLGVLGLLYSVLAEPSREPAR